MAAAKRKSIAKLCLALELFVPAGFFRQANRRKKRLMDEMTSLSALMVRLECGNRFPFA